MQVKLEQSARRLTLRSQAKQRFVAEFIGTPKNMNLITADKITHKENE